MAIMINIIKNISISVCLLSISTFSNASLITNGSFEQTTFTDNSSSVGVVKNTELDSYENRNSAWDVFTTLPGWVTSYGNGIELQKNVVTNSQSGSHHVELDSHQKGASNAVMTQTVDSLTIGNDYLLEFYYKPRTNTANDNGINVFWYESSIDFSMDMEAGFVADSTKLITPNWQKQSVAFTASSTSMDLSFGSFGKQNTLGGLIDNVSLTSITQVSEPSILALLLLPIGLMVTRKRKHK